MSINSYEGICIHVMFREVTYRNDKFSNNETYFHHKYKSIWIIFSSSMFNILD